ncbi:Fe2+-dicitrate sensor membrane component [Novosphingobium sp. LASN5T]|nr:Fe2+-dicitrate sensor membrane component [Novosphingobium sp. LASN5T]
MRLIAMSAETHEAQGGAMEAAIAWHVQMPAMDAARWADLVAWLEAAPEHQAAFDRVAAADRLLAEAPVLRQRSGEKVPAPPMRVRRGWWRAGAGVALAASLAGVALWTVAPRDRQPTTFATAAGKMQTVRLAEGTAVVLNGDTRLARGDGERSVRLDGGEALFAVRHRADAPFTVEAGRYRIVDVGTVFNVRRDAGRLMVSVSEGSVMVDPDGARLALHAGEGLTIDEASGLATRWKAASVGGWQRGELDFDRATLADVVAAFHRRNGAEIRLEGGLSALPFTGNVRLSGETARDVEHLARLVGVDCRREGEIWVLSPSKVRS